jgi:bifunctional UDP-N-acetylglucosamine pyrophosphorylase/glucosamine-1-phosphate N-acetyltransferase
MGLKAVILAAGKGTRMKSDVLKVAHGVAGKPIVSYVVETVSELDVSDIFLVVGHQAELLKSAISHPKVTYVLQEEQLGTGHAVMQVADHLDLYADDIVIVLAGDCPLIEDATLRNLIAIHGESNAAATILTTNMECPGTYGRILRGKMGTVLGIREAKDCSPDELQIKEVNTGVYVFQVQDLFKSLNQVTTNNAQREYYLTDVIQILKKNGQPIAAYRTERSDHAIGVNTRMDLAAINKILYRNNNLYFMQEGVTIVDPDSTFIDSTVCIGHDTIIQPFSVIQGNTHIGSRCVIGPHVFIKDAKIEDNSIIPPFTKMG